MKVGVRSRNLEVTPALREAVEEKITRLSRFLQGMDTAEVSFTEEKNPRIADKEVCEVTMHGHGHIVRAKATAHDSLAAVDLVVDKLEHRLEKLKGKLLARSHPRHRPRKGHLSQVQSNGALAEAVEDADPEDNRPQVVKSKRFELKPMTTEEAVLQMELLGHDWFLFCSSETGGSAVVYHRGDGQIGLVEAT